jgi:hypothetical protein
MPGKALISINPFLILIFVSRVSVLFAQISFTQRWEEDCEEVNKENKSISFLFLLLPFLIAYLCILLVALFVSESQNDFSIFVLPMVLTV